MVLFAEEHRQLVQFLEKNMPLWRCRIGLIRLKAQPGWVYRL